MKRQDQSKRELDGDIIRTMRWFSDTITAAAEYQPEQITTSLRIKGNLTPEQVQDVLNCLGDNAEGAITITVVLPRNSEAILYESAQARLFDDIDQHLGT